METKQIKETKTKFTKVIMNENYQKESNGVLVKIEAGTIGQYQYPSEDIEGYSAIKFNSPFTHVSFRVEVPDELFEEEKPYHSKGFGLVYRNPYTSTELLTKRGLSYFDVKNTLAPLWNNLEDRIFQEELDNFMKVGKVGQYLLFRCDIYDYCIIVDAVDSEEDYGQVY